MVESDLYLRRDGVMKLSREEPAMFDGTCGAPGAMRHAGPG